MASDPIKPLGYTMEEAATRLRIGRGLPGQVA